MEKQTEIIKGLVEKMLEKLSVSGQIDVVDGDDCLQFMIKTSEAGLLIGENGQHLVALNHLLKKLADAEFRKQELEQIRFMADVNDYQAKKIEELKNTARMNAQRVRYFKKEVEMEPMNSYDRRIVHFALTEDADIQTESVGEGLSRRVVIKLCE